MALFAKRFYGFNPGSWPVVSFGQDAYRDGLLRASKPGDWILFVGTMTAETSPDDQGRLLGLAEFGRQTVDTLDVLRPEDIRSDRDYNERREFRWPKSLPMVRAWTLTGKPLLKEVLGAQLPMNARTMAVLLDAEDAAAVLRLPREAAVVREAPVVRRIRELGDALTGGRPTTGPVPSSWSGTISRSSEVEAWTYALRFGVRNVWKIGHAQNLRERLSDINKHVPHEVLNERWVIAYQHKWPTQLAAYEMEQRVLKALRRLGDQGERVTCGEGELLKSWRLGLVND
jgi:hypothetical protein